MQRFTPATCVSDEDLLSSIQVMRDEAEQGVELLVDRILANAIINGNNTELATLHRECEIWLFDFKKIYIHRASVKARVTFLDSYHGDIVTINNLAEYNPFLHRYKIEIIDFI